jgi:hypothetical protein
LSLFAEEECSGRGRLFGRHKDETLKKSALHHHHHHHTQQQDDMIVDMDEDSHPCLVTRVKAACSLE